MYITCLKTKQILDVEPGVHPSYYHNLLGWLDRLFARYRKAYGLPAHWNIAYYFPETGLSSN